MDVFQCIASRRSVRTFLREPLPADTIERIAEAVRWAPSWANTQCVQLVAVQLPERISQLAEFLSERNPARQAFDVAPLVMVLCARRGLAGHKKGQPVTDKGDWYMFDAGIAAQQIGLVVHALGLGTVNVGLFDHQAAARLLGLPGGVEVIELFPIGVPARQPDPPPRKPMDELLLYDHDGGQSA